MNKSSKKPFKSKCYSLLTSNKKLILFIILMSVFRSAVADWYTVPTGSMQPTIQEGDRVVVNKMAYDIRLPFTEWSLLRLNLPQRGEIAVFESKATDMRLIKRIIGLPGDVVSMKNEIIKINGETLTYKPVSQNASIQSSIETIGVITHHINIDTSKSNNLSNFSPITVPAGHYLVLGDNRRNSADSRVYGFVPHKELRGKATAIAFSFNYDNYYLPRSERFLQDIYDI